MDITKFEKFSQQCSEYLPKEIEKILNDAKDEKTCAIGFITTDDFYGFYLAWDYSKDIYEFFEWKNGLSPAFLYQPLVDIVESCNEIDFCRPSEEKWDFGQTLLSVLDKNIKEIPDELFHKYNFKREDILFFASMSDGDYMDKMLSISEVMFNTPK